MPQLVLTQEEALKAFYDSLCNVYGSGWFEGYGLEWDYDDAAYNEARKKLKDPCIEDVLLQMIKDGGELRVKDVEGEGEQDGKFTLATITENISTVPFRHMADYLNENDDVITGDVILQCILYKEIVFG